MFFDLTGIEDLSCISLGFEDLKIKTHSILPALKELQPWLEGEEWEGVEKKGKERGKRQPKEAVLQKRDIPLIGHGSEVSQGSQSLKRCHKEESA